MNVTKITTISDFLSFCHMPIYYKSSIRLMKKGDIFFFGQCKLNDFHIAEAWIEKDSGKYSFYGTWTIPTATKRDFIMTFGDFNLLKRGIIKFDDKNITSECLYSFALVCRYINHIIKKRPIEDKKKYYRLGMKPFLTQQLQAIVTAGIAIGAIPSSNIK